MQVLQRASKSLGGAETEGSIPRILTRTFVCEEPLDFPRLELPLGAFDKAFAKLRTRRQDCAAKRGLLCLVAWERRGLSPRAGSCDGMPQGIKLPVSPDYESYLRLPARPQHHDRRDVRAVHKAGKPVQVLRVA